MKAVIFYIVVSCVALGMAATLALMPQPQQKVINCGIAEISPDFTTDMRQACRKARMEKII